VHPAGDRHFHMSCKILIVDDSAVVRHSLRSCIEVNPTITVCGEAENGQVAIDKVKELKPDVVILDWQMPVMNGLEAARHIARFVPKPAMVLLTFHSGDECQASSGCRYPTCLLKVREPHTLGCLANHHASGCG
jgi:chemotaxis response regulator CheB